jgi:hypothetical protein
MACTPKRCGLIMTEFTLNFQNLRNPGVTIGIFAIAGPLSQLGRPIVLPDIITLAERALKNAVADEAPQQDPNQINRVFGIIPDPELPPCENGCECAGVVYKELKKETVIVDAIFTFTENTYSARTTATRTVSEGVGRCRSDNYETMLTFGEIPDLNLEIILARAKPLTEDELAKVREVFNTPTET